MFQLILEVFYIFIELSNLKLSIISFRDTFFRWIIQIREKFLKYILWNNFRFECHLVVYRMLFAFVCIKGGINVALKTTASYGKVTLCFSFKCLHKWVKKSASVRGSTKSHSWQWNTVSPTFPGSFWVCHVDKCTLSALNDLNVHRHSLWRQGSGDIRVWHPCFKR